ncbi:hypothetical protein BDR22DRAFT_849275 [Usnea florida]
MFFLGFLSWYHVKSYVMLCYAMLCHAIRCEPQLRHPFPSYPAHFLPSFPPPPPFLTPYTSTHPPHIISFLCSPLLHAPPLHLTHITPQFSFDCSSHTSHTDSPSSTHDVSVPRAK